MALLFAVVDQFNYLSVREIGFLGSIALASVLIDHLSGLVGGKLGGATKKALWFGLLGSIIGFVVLPPFGTIIGLFLGMLAGGIASGQAQHKAMKAATTSVLGSMAGMASNFILAITFIVLFMLFVRT